MMQKELWSFVGRPSFRKSESGRSMVEILGVLAVIGVLTVGGIYGYTYAMMKNKVNEASHLVSMVETEMETTSVASSQKNMNLEFLKDSSVSVEDVGSDYKKAGIVVDFEDDITACKQFAKMYQDNPRFAVEVVCEEK